MPWWLSRLFGWLTPSPPPEPEPEPPADDPEPWVESPLSADHYPGHTRLQVDIYQTTELTQQNGRYPEQNAARFLTRALEHAGYNHVTTFDHEPVDLPDDAASDTLDRFREAIPMADVTLLIGYRWGGGRAGPHYGLVTGRELDHQLLATDTAPTGSDGRVGFPYKHVLNHLHEVNHCLGGGHPGGISDTPSLLYPPDAIDGFDRPAPDPEHTAENYDRPYAE